MKGNQKTFDFFNEFAGLTLDVIGEVAFSYKFHLITEGNPWSHNMHQIIDGISRRTIVPKVLWPLLVRDSKKWEKVSQEMRELIKVISTHFTFQFPRNS